MKNYIPPAPCSVTLLMSLQSHSYCQSPHASSKPGEECLFQWTGESTSQNEEDYIWSSHTWLCCSFWSLDFSSSCPKLSNVKRFNYDAKMPPSLLCMTEPEFSNLDGDVRFKYSWNKAHSIWSTLKHFPAREEKHFQNESRPVPKHLC